MKLKYFDGCMNYSTTVDDKELVDMDIEDVKRVIIKLVPKCSDISVLQQFFTHILETEGVMTNFGICEQCGDSLYAYEMNIDGLI